jgi:protein phosphatase
MLPDLALARRLSSGHDEAVEGGSTTSYATLSDAGTERRNNEDACGAHVEHDGRVLLAVADGVSGEEGASIASQIAIDVTLKAYRDSPAEWALPKRLYRAVQQANIEIHDKALVVTELRRMATTLTAIVLDGLTVHAAHVGDTRLYSVRGADIVQRTKDHSLARRRKSGAALRDDPGRSILTRSLGRDLIAAVDRLTFPVARGDFLVVCSDGLYTVLEDEEIRNVVATMEPSQACRALISTANARGTPDNLTVAVVKVTADHAEPTPGTWSRILRRFR